MIFGLFLACWRLAVKATKSSMKASEPSPKSVYFTNEHKTNTNSHSMLELIVEVVDFELFWGVGSVCLALFGVPTAPLLLSKEGSLVQENVDNWG